MRILEKRLPRGQLTTRSKLGRMDMQVLYEALVGMIMSERSLELFTNGKEDETGSGRIQTVHQVRPFRAGVICLRGQSVRPAH